MTFPFPTFSLGDGSASVFRNQDGSASASRESHRAVVSESQAVACWQRLVSEVPEVSTEGQKRDRQRLFAARLCGVDLY